jgi:hypothetical protein
MEEDSVMMLASTQEVKTKNLCINSFGTQHIKKKKKLTNVVQIITYLGFFS